MGLPDDAAETSKIGGPYDWFNREGAWDARYAIEEERLNAIEEGILWHERQVALHQACAADLNRQFSKVCRSPAYGRDGR